MTPPRSEAWAFCFGAGLALVWFMARNGYQSSLKVAFVTMLGAGFGFAFGNFLQVVGNILEINFNMWNVMEYSIGFFGGGALAYSIFTSPWPQNVQPPTHWENRVSYIIALLFFPVIVFQQSMSFEALSKRLGGSGIDSGVVAASTIVSSVLIFAAIVFYVWKFEKTKFIFTKKSVFLVYIVFISLYVAISFIVSGVLAGVVLSNHILYLVNIGVVLFLLTKIQNPFSIEPNSFLKQKHFLVLFVILAIILLLALLLVNIHTGLSGSQIRFGQ
jgi:hypothetical protein